jgi:hypothetical protein
MAKVKVYWNLHKGCWSVMDAGTRKVIGHAMQILIREASFSVSETGRERVRATRRKEVHAFVIGEIEAAIWHKEPAGMGAYRWDNHPMLNNYMRNVANQRGITVTYNPLRDQGFIERESGRPVDNSPACYLTWETRPGQDLTPRPRVLSFDPGCERNENIAA